MQELTKLEELVMIAIWKLGDKAYGVKIKNLVKEIGGREYFYNTLYTTFQQLLKKGCVTKHFGDPQPVRGGKRKVYFTLTESGLKELEIAFERQSRIWVGITKESFRKGQAG